MTTDYIQRGILWTALLVLAGCSIYGIEHQKLLQQDIWTHAGLRRFLIFAAGFTVFFVAYVLWKPGLYPAVLAVIAIIYSIAAAGPLALLTVALVLFSSFALGSSILVLKRSSLPDHILATLFGVSIYIFVISIAAHWKVNYWPVYLFVLVLPWTWNWRTPVRSIAHIPRLLRPLKLSRMELLAAGALALILTAHWLIALQPEVGPDALAVHLAVPDSVAWSHQFPFDVNQRLWEVMPMGGDWSFTLCYLLGGEPAARLFNFALLLGIVTLLISTIRKWLPLAPALFMVALFAATPLVQLVTGSLFVENLWALLCLGALVSMDSYRDRDDQRYLYLAFILLGAAAATKFGALAFLLAVMLISVWILWRKRTTSSRFRLVAIAALCFVLFAAPPYVSALIKTGSPVFPYMTRIFPSRFPALAAGAGALPPGQHLSLRSLFDLTFHTSLFYEVQDGATGFQYFLVLPMGVLLLFLKQPGRKWPPLAVWSGIAGGLFGALTLVIQPDVRYLYPAFAPATLFIAAAIAQLGTVDVTLYRTVIVCIVAVFFLDLYFLPSSGWMHKDFLVNPASRAVRTAYLTAYSPERNLIADMNRAHAGAATAFFESNATAGLRAATFTSSWHSAAFNNRLSIAGSAPDCFRILRDFGVNFVIAPAPDSGIRITTTAQEAFLRQCTTAEFTSGRFYAGRVKDSCGDTEVQPVASPGTYDDVDGHITFQGVWSHGGFPEASGGTLTWANTPGATARLRFEGTELTYVYTKAFNRGLAEISIDGQSKGTLDLYSPAIAWRTSATLRTSAGIHTFEIRVSGRRTPASSGTFVDLDALIVH